MKKAITVWLFSEPEHGLVHLHSDIDSFVMPPRNAVRLARALRNLVKQELAAIEAANVETKEMKKNLKSWQRGKICRVDVDKTPSGVGFSEYYEDKGGVSRLESYVFLEHAQAVEAAQAILAEYEVSQ